MLQTSQFLCQSSGQSVVLSTYLVICRIFNLFLRAFLSGRIYMYIRVHACMHARAGARTHTRTKIRTAILVNNVYLVSKVVRCKRIFTLTGTAVARRP